MIPEQDNTDTNQQAGLRQSIEKKIRATILQGVFAPGEHIVESKISEQLQVSPSPIREVLSALEQEGLVISQPRRGYFMVNFSEKDIHEIYSFRVLLEKFAINRSIHLMADGPIRFLQQLIESMKQAEDSPDGLALLAETDMAFHDTFFSLSDHKRLQAAWQSIRSQNMILMRITSQTHMQQARHPYQNHQDLLELIKQKDLANIDTTLIDHIEDGMQRALEAIRMPSEEA